MKWLVHQSRPCLGAKVSAVKLRGGVEDTRLEAKDTKKFRGQGHRRKCSPKKRKFSKKIFKQSHKKGLQKFFSGEKGLQKFFSDNFHLRKTEKGLRKFFCEVSGAFQQNFNRLKYSALLEPRTGQFSRT